MLRKVILFVAVLGLISCEKDNITETLPTYKWELVSEMSNRNFVTGTVINDDIVLMSKDSVVTFDAQHKILKTQIIAGKKSVETRSPYILEKTDIVGIPTYYFPNPGSTDSIAIRFQKINSDFITIVDHNQIPGFETRGYKTRMFKSNIMSNYGGDFSVIMHGWNKSDSSATNSTDDYYHILRINIRQTASLSSSIDKMIEIPELPFFKSPEKYNLIRFKDFDFILASDGTHVIDDNGYKNKIESTQAIFKDSDNLMQLRGNSVFASEDGLTWTKQLDIENNVDWSTTNVVRLFDNILIDYGVSKWLKYVDLETGKTENITDNGLPDANCTFIIDLNGYYYLGLENESVYRIKKNQIF